MAKRCFQSIGQVVAGVGVIGSDVDGSSKSVERLLALAEVQECASQIVPCLGKAVFQLDRLSKPLHSLPGLSRCVQNIGEVEANLRVWAANKERLPICLSRLA